MFLNFKKISDAIIHENPEGSHPIAWENHYKTLNFTLSDIKIVQTFGLHEVDLFDDGENLIDIVKPSTSYKEELVCTIDSLSQINNIYIGVKKDDNITAKRIKSFSEKTQVILRGINIEGERKNNLPSRAHLFENAQGEFLYLDLIILSSLIKKLITSLKNNRHVTINISLLVSVFTCSHEMALTSGEEELDHVVIVPTTMYVSNISIEE